MPTIGDCVIDGFKPTSNWIDHGIEWLDDVSEFFKERAAIEKEAAAKLATLASRFHSKKAQVTSAVSVGEHPLTTPGSLESSSMESYTIFLNQVEQIAADRKSFSDSLQKRISDEVSTLKTKYHDVSKQFDKINEHFEENKEKQMKTLKKSKQHYDLCCEQMESARAKGKKNVESKENDMYHAKNSYIIQVNIANRLKDKYYHDDIPELLDTFQLVNEARIAQTNKLIADALKFELDLNSKIKNCLDVSVSAINGNEPNKDTQMFIEHNANSFQWNDPTDFFFEPSPIWHDNEEMHVSTNDSQQFLGALLNDANKKSITASQDSEKRMHVYENAKNSLKSTNFSELPVSQTQPLLKSVGQSLEQLVLAESERMRIEVEIETISASTASVDMSHVPQTRVKVQRSLFGKKKEVVEVVGEGTHHNKTLGLTSLLSRSSAQDDGTQALVLYDFEAGAERELSVKAGTQLQLVAGDDGSGWVTLASLNGTGLVPASYVEILFGGKKAQNKAAPPPPPSRGSKESKVQAIYEYTAQDSNQLSIHPGDVITVTSGDNGGWTTGVLNGQTGIFPSAYVKSV